MHTSPIVQRLPSLHDAELMVCLQPTAMSQKSLVQGLPSLQLGAGPPTQRPASQPSPVVQALPSSQGPVPFVYSQRPVAELQVSLVQGLPSLQFLGVPAQTPPAQRSGLVQLFPSLQVAVLLVYAQPVVLLQESMVHGLLSLQLTEDPPVHLPFEQKSLVVHAFLSSHVVVLGAGL
jgi:hypothetical protein